MSNRENDAVLELYRTTVRNMLANDKPGVVPNASYRHASIIIEELVRSAKQSFFAYCEKLSSDVWSRRVLDQLQAAIIRGVEVRIILTEEPDSDMPDFMKGHIKILRISQLGENQASYEAIEHFAVVDGKSLRLEQNKRTREALFAANRPDVAHELEEIFLHLRDASEAA